MDVSDDEVDEVIREIDVYTTDNDANVFLFQFPLRPSYSDPPSISSVNYKPQHKKVEISVPYPTEILSIDKSKRSMLEDEEQKLLSSSVKQSAFLAIGVMSDNCLHMTAVDEILQMRPTFQNIKAGEEIQDLMDDEDDVKPEFDVKPLQQVSLKRKESERAQSNRKQSYGYIHSAEENEAWIRLQHYEIDSLESNENFEDLYYQEKADHRTRA